MGTNRKSRRLSQACMHLFFSRVSQTCLVNAMEIHNEYHNVIVKMSVPTQKKRRTSEHVSHGDDQLVQRKKQKRPTTAIETIRSRIHIHLHPSSLLDIDLGIREHINSLLLAYNESLDGIPIAYRDLSRVSNTLHVSPYFPLCDVCVDVTFTAVRPQKGMILSGTVTEVSDTFIGILVFNLVNCVVPIERIEGFSYSVFQQKWKNKSDVAHTIGQGDAVRIRVEQIENHGGGYMTVLASLPLQDPNGDPSVACGNIEYLKLNLPLKEKKKKKEKKAKKDKKEKKKK